MIRTLLLLTLCVSLSSCFQTGSSPQASSSGTSSSSLITSSDFAGAKNAVNTVTGVQISWEASKVTPTSYRVYRVAGTKLTLLATLAGDITSFIDGTVTWGTLYSYIVRAVDTNNAEDNNTTKVTSLSWAGISSVTSSSRTSLTVNFASSTAVADEIRIYLQPTSGGDKVLAATATGSDSSVTISGLRIGFSYTVSAQAYVSSLKKEDGNTVTFTASTNTLGYHDDDSSTAKWLNVTNVRAFGAAPAAAVHPSYPERTPRTELVEISFRSFSGMDTSTKYIVERASENYPLDTSVEASCDTTTLTSCRVKCSSSATILTGTGILNCRDEKAGPAPVRYRYTMSILHEDGSLTWAEPVPQDQLEYFSVSVPMPPSNMVLTQRDAVNYEMCNQMNAAIDPRHHNRCPYSGIGAVPYNTGPGKPPLTFDSGYYDFGYNLFVDRYEMGCHWTRAVDGGMCGAGATSGDCIGNMSVNTYPSNTIGKEGDVFLALWSSGGMGETTCLYKYGGSWVRSVNVASTVPNSTNAFSQMYTSDPAANGGKIAALREYQSQYQAWTECQSQSDSYYGQKRLPRMREHRAYTTFATMPNDLYGVTYSAANTLANGNSFSAANGYRCAVNMSTTSLTFPSSLGDILSTSNEMMAMYSGGSYYGGTFQLASVANVDCQGRYGIQNVMNLWVNNWVSDNFNWNSTTKLLTGTTSYWDNGNRDLQQDLTGGSTGFQVDYTNAAVNGTSYYYFQMNNSTSNAVNYVALPLGMPILLTSSTVYLPRTLLIENYGSNFYAPYASSPSYTPRSVYVSGRWGTSTTIPAPSGNITTTTRCVLPAD